MTVFVCETRLGTEGGPRVAVKDTIDIAGLPTRAGTPALADAPPAPAHAQVVAHLLAAGGQIVGKTVLHELAFGITGINDACGTPVNPRFPALIPGGSSSGSAAAVAAGLAEIALGTDTGGSIRTPAACCGIWGLKPSFGRISRAGVMPAETTLDCVGPMAADGAGILRGMELIDPSFRRESCDHARIGALQVQAVAPIRQAVAAALQRCGWPVQPVELPGFDAAFEAGLAVINAETLRAAAPLLAGGRVGADVATRLARAAATSPADLAAAEAVRLGFTAEVDALLDRVDVIALPTLADLPPTLAEGRQNRSAIALTRLVRPFNLSGHPALALPLGTHDGAPISLQLVGRHGGDARLCAIAVALAARLAV